MGYTPVLLCTFKDKCYWQHKCHTRKGKEYKVCRMVKKFPNETCNQLKIVSQSLAELKGEKHG